MNETPALSPPKKVTPVHVEEQAMALDLPSGPVRLPVKPLPDQYIDWIDKGRRSMYQRILEPNEAVEFFSQHLPVIVTYTKGSPFPFNCGNKGVGFLPKAEYLEEYTNLYQETMNGTRGIPWEDSLRERIKVVSKFNFDRQAIDYRCLTTLEIFEKQTFKNLSDNPVASLLYTGVYPEYLSFQLNCGVEVLGQEDPRHTFIMLSRSLFEYDEFHIAQPQFPYAYLFWISEIKDKTPFRVKEQPDRAQYFQQAGDLFWEEEATIAVNRAPSMIQKHIRSEVEKYAKQRGFGAISAAVVYEAKKALRG